MDSIYKLKKRYLEFGGYKLLRKYLEMGVEFVAIKAAIKGVIKGSLYEAYKELQDSVNPILIKRYLPLAQELKAKYDRNNSENNHSNIIWFCWLQGLDNWPDIVKCSYNSIKMTAKEKEIIVICYDNIEDYITLPPYIWDLHKKGVIPKHSFAVLVRLELLIKYGGTWIDSTCLCTSELPSEIMDSDLFMFQTVEKDQTNIIGISNWFISACSNNEALLILRDILYQYWKDFDCLVNNYIYHLFFKMIANEYPELIKGMPVWDRGSALKLIKVLDLDYNNNLYQRSISESPVHKLSFRISKKTKDNNNSIYNYIIHQYCS